MGPWLMAAALGLGATPLFAAGPTPRPVWLTDYARARAEARFDYDLTWAGFLLGPDEVVCGRCGGRDAASADGRLSLAGLRHAMQSALDFHRRLEAERRVPRKARPLRAEDYPAARRLRRGECIHCHQVYEFRRAERQAKGLWKRDEVWGYPLPESVGLTLEVDRGDRVRGVARGSPPSEPGCTSGTSFGGSTASASPPRPTCSTGCTAPRARRPSPGSAARKSAPGNWSWPRAGRRPTSPGGRHCSTSCPR